VSSELRWHEPGRIFLCTYSGQVTADEITSDLQTILRHLDSATGPLHVIVDWRAATDYPYFADFIFPGLKILRHRNMGWIVLVGENRTVKLWVDLFEHIEDFRYKIVPSFEDATAFLRTVVM
jgi:hypothetical protein